jgi:flagellar motility protein MotE (MotC chaperone)
MKPSNDIRILPAVIGVGIILLGLKAAGLAFPAEAAQTPAQAAAAAAPAANAPAAAPASGDAAPVGADAMAAIDAARARPRVGPNTNAGENGELPDLNATDITAAQMDVLTRLSDRRDALDDRQRQLEMQANVLAATEKRVDAKINELKALEAQIQKLLDQREGEDAAQLDALVRVYSAMKPRDAARIFEKLDGPVRLSVAGKMKPDVMAGLLASLPADVAQKLTVELASRYRMPETPPAMRPSSDTAAPAAPAAAANVPAPPAAAAPRANAAEEPDAADEADTAEEEPAPIGG